MKSARCWSLRVRPDASVFEIDGADAWAELVSRYPLSVKKSRRHDWFRTTGHDLSWAIPDFHAVALDYDAIHLSGMGYLSAVGRAIAAGDFHTVLAGWNPDETWWLTDSPQRIGPAVRWTATDKSEPFSWAPTT